MGAHLWRILWLFTLVGSTVLAAAWWWLAPGGFGAAHPRFWINSVAPPCGLGLSIAALLSLHRNSAHSMRWLLPLWPSGLAAAGLAGRILFPITLRWFWLVPLGAALVLSLALFPLWRPPHRTGRLGPLLVYLCAAMAGAGLVWTQRPPPFGTRPCNAPLAELGDTSPGERSTFLSGVHLDRTAMVQASDGSLLVRL
jgi:hypothetical protein